MKILVVNYEFPPLGGGGGIAAYAMAKELSAKGHSVDYLTTAHKSLPDFEVIDGISVYRANVLWRSDIETASMISMLSFPIAAFFKGAALCRKNRYDLINTHFAVPSGPLGFMLSKLFHVKNMLFIHGGDIYDPSKKLSPHLNIFTRWTIRFLLNHADMTIAQSTNTKQNCIEYYGPQKEIQILPLPYESKLLNGRVDHPGKKYVIGIGRLIKRKDFGTFIKAISLLDESVEGIIIGDGPEKEGLKRVAESLKISQRMHFTGAVSGEQKFQHLANADIYLLSSLHEGYGIVLQEAMQAGLPVVATDEGGQTDLVTDGKNGFLVKPKDAEAMAEKIKILLNDSNLRKAFSDASKERLKECSPERVYERYMDLTKKVLDS